MSIDLKYALPKQGEVKTYESSFEGIDPIHELATLQADNPEAFKKMTRQQTVHSSDQHESVLFCLYESGYLVAMRRVNDAMKTSHIHVFAVRNAADYLRSVSTVKARVEQLAAYRAEQRQKAKVA